MAIAFPPSSPASADEVLSIKPPAPVTAKRGTTFEVSLRAELLPGYHANSNTPTDEFLIPLKLTWSADPLELAAVEFPAPKMERYSFADDPLSVFSGNFDIRSRFRVSGQTPPGKYTLAGKLRYQACTDNLCLPPKTVSVSLPVAVE